MSAIGIVKKPGQFSSHPKLATVEQFAIDNAQGPMLNNFTGGSKLQVASFRRMCRPIPMFQNHVKFNKGMIRNTPLLNILFNWVNISEIYSRFHVFRKGIEKEYSKTCKRQIDSVSSLCQWERMPQAFYSSLAGKKLLQNVFNSSKEMFLFFILASKEKKKKKK